jgi:hypothetical protein
VAVSTAKADPNRQRRRRKPGPEAQGGVGEYGDAALITIDGVPLETLLKRPAAARLGGLGGAAARKMKWHARAIIIDDGAPVGATIAARIRRLRDHWKPEWPPLPEYNAIRTWMAKGRPTRENSSLR